MNTIERIVIQDENLNEIVEYKNVLNYNYVWGQSRAIALEISFEKCSTTILLKKGWFIHVHYDKSED